MFQRVLDQRLEEHRGNRRVRGFRIDRNGDAQPIFEADGFERQIIRNDLDLLRERRRVDVMLLQVIAKNIREARDHILRLRRILAYHPANRVQAIEQEMGIHLAFERTQLGFAQGEPALHGRARGSDRHIENGPADHERRNAQDQ